MDELRVVVASSYGGAGASTRVRALDWLSFLAIPAQVKTYLGTANVRPGTLVRHPARAIRAEAELLRLRSAPPIDRLFISRSMGPFTRGHLEATLLRRADWGVYDFDDALWADGRRGIHRIFGESSVWERAVRSADQVIAGSDYLAEAAAGLNPNVEKIPSCVDPHSYVPKESYAVGPVPRLLWVGSPATEQYLELVTAPLLKVHRLTGARLTVISGGRRPLGEIATITDRVHWDGARTNAKLAEADCGIMPLPDNAFTRGKCAYKLLEYGAAGLPIVASPVGANREVVEKLEGVPAVDTASWVEALVELLRGPEKERRLRGTASRRAVAEHYSFSAWRQRFVQASRLPAGASASSVVPGCPSSSA